MKESLSVSEARERVLDAAEQLFAQKGYSSVTLRDIGAAVGIRHASLYHHVPGGKQQLFIEVTERHLARHSAGLSRAIEHAEPTVRAQLQAVAGWLLSQPPMDMIRMVFSDMPSIDPAQAQRLSWLTYQSMISPIEQVLLQAQQRGEVDHPDLALVAGGLLGMIESLHAVPQNVLDPQQTREQMAYQLIDVLLDGIRFSHTDR